MAQRGGLAAVRALRRVGSLARQLAPARRAAAAVVTAPLHTTAKTSVRATTPAEFLAGFVCVAALASISF